MQIKNIQKTKTKIKNKINKIININNKTNKNNKNNKMGIKNKVDKQAKVVVNMYIFGKIVVCN